MFSACLFLGFPVDPLFAEKLKKANPALLNAFIQEGGEDLCEINYRQMRYIGKRLGSIISLDNLELLEKNIYSFLKRLVPDFPYEEAPLYLVSLLDDHS